MRSVVSTFAMLVCCGAWGCGSDSSAASNGPDAGRVPETSFAGTVDGRPFVVRDGITAVTQHWKSGLFPGDSTVVVLSDSTGLCDQMSTNLTKPGTQQLILDLGEVASGTAAPITSPGTFPWSKQLVSPRTSQMYYSFIDSACGFKQDFASAGQVTISDAGSATTSLRGSLEVTLGRGSLSGDFSAESGCPTTTVDTYLDRTPRCQ